MSVGDNVAFPMRRHTDWSDADIRDRAKKKLADVGLEQEFDKMPGDLSGGMKKRAGLARAMALDPSILLVDEPSAGLDPITAGEIDDLLVKTKQGGTTLVVVTHNIPSARIIGDRLRRACTTAACWRAARSTPSTVVTSRWCRHSCIHREAASGHTGEIGGRRRVRAGRSAVVRGRSVHDRRSTNGLREEVRRLHRVQENHGASAWRDRASVRREGGHHYANSAARHAGRKIQGEARNHRRPASTGAHRLAGHDRDRRARGWKLSR